MGSAPLRVYVDTSVFGGVFDEEFARPSAEFFGAVRTGIHSLVVSDIVKKEIADAPAAVQDLFQEFLPLAEIVDVTYTALWLREAYINAGVVSWKRADDALHVALATVSGCSMIVSWNFKHIVHFQKGSTL